MDKPTRRKYTRKVTAAVASVVPLKNQINANDLLDPASELELAVDIVTRLRALDTKARARVMMAIGRLL